MALKKYEVVSSSPAVLVLQKAASPLKKAWFIPDESTDFEKPCLLRLEFTSPPQGSVTIALWAKYKGKDYDLDHKRNIQVTGTVSEELLSLYYVDQHQSDIVSNGGKDAKAFYYARITANGAVSVSELLEMPIAGQVYKKDNYDDTVATSAKNPKSGANYKAGKGIALLQRMLISSKFLKVASPTGTYGPKTEEAVKAFQTCALSKERQKRGVLINVSVSFKGKADGIADVPTQEELKYWSKMEYCKPIIIPKFRFPLDAQYRDTGYRSGGRSFGAVRDGGRIHAGCDLYAPAGALVYAAEGGKIVYYHNFYWQTYELQIEHMGTIVRYGEVQPPKTGHGYPLSDMPPDNLRNGLYGSLKVGDEVKKGQPVAYVGQLRQYNKVTTKYQNYSATMLHLEIYSGEGTGSLTQDNATYNNVPKKNYIRRSDLLNPTQYIDNMTNT